MLRLTPKEEYSSKVTLAKIKYNVMQLFSKSSHNRISPFKRVLISTISTLNSTETKMYHNITAILANNRFKRAIIFPSSSL